ncbi:hypothetical protein COEREDRAFT_79631 [Coemansia reversa NRRL 1564]|uniref:Uncharacterized protein n=1 Tax=Coemansia reversa (strain ATCC 12441 / NRRL 1564) TaxID=763665 RepID=A0A2G5BIL1_COERN|nr:hypothetical protein COEREDRAFT_79631 [Coemansia reversa NRRL 1564]|eukprot:PIA18597.1 hypothetical protein COEREDRAFT_79631 [Coemansia reversa NRRL 1564]
MTCMLQLLQISAGFVPVLSPSPHTLSAHFSMSIAEWHTRRIIYRNMQKVNYSLALILDYSVDIELTIRIIMQAVHQHIPQNWDVLFPRHYGAFEYRQFKPNPALPFLEIANMLICLYAYAVFRAGAKKTTWSSQFNPKN